MTKRGMQFGGEGRYLFENGQGQAGAEILPDDRVTGTTRWLLSTRHTQNLSNCCPASRATGITTRSPTTRTFRICRTASVSRRRRRCRAKSASPTPTGRGRCWAGAGIPDAAGSRGPSPAHPVQPRAAGARDAARLRLERAHFRRGRRIRVLPAADADDGPARVRVADRRHRATGRGVVVHGAHRSAHAPIRLERGAARRALDARVTPYRSRRSTGVWSSSATGASPARISCRRWSRAPSTSTFPTRTRARRRYSIRRSTISTSASCSASTGISATTGSATRTRSRSR